MNHTPLIALISTHPEIDTKVNVAELSDKSAEKNNTPFSLKPYSDLLWMLRRLGVANIIAHS